MQSELAMNKRTENYFKMFDNSYKLRINKSDNKIENKSFN